MNGFCVILWFSTDPEVPCLPERATKLLRSNAGFSSVKYPEIVLVILEEILSAVGLAGAESCLSSFPEHTGMAKFGSPESGANLCAPRGSTAVIFVTAIA